MFDHFTWICFENCLFHRKSPRAQSYE